MKVLYHVCRAMLILGIGGMLISIVFMLGAFLTACPLWLVLGASVVTIIVGAIIGHYVDWL